MSINLITPEDEKEIVSAIQEAEKNTSGEIRVHIEKECKEDVFSRAKNVFEYLKMHETELKNGVLFYVSTIDRRFYILGDQGINKVVTDDFWESTKEVVIAHFKKEQFKQGLVEGILKAGEQLKKFFPYATDDINELSDEISRG
ncbi:TPM domain-containing protein [Mesonia sp. MT50]|uniref:TPM domain-containing protein n=1 Tax=Mesonia profundi TaxID=3070998 RepID=A0ABU1A3N6_9FLAO|nr:TPM domain-containing protein [Mesonia profundi]MDQ7917548.1 TPM domain-containing protein [Mesonia profundi]